MAAQLMHGQLFERTVRFVLFTGEEQGFVRQRCYAATASRQAITSWPCTTWI